MNQKPASRTLFEKPGKLISVVTRSRKLSFDGYLDSIANRELTGWAKGNGGDVFVRVYHNGNMISAIQPNIHRDDLCGKYGFKVRVSIPDAHGEFTKGNISIFMESQDGTTRTPISINGELCDDIAIANFSKHLPLIDPKKLHDIFFKIHEIFYNLGDNEARNIHNSHLLNYTNQVFGGFLESVENDVLIGWAKGVGVPVIVRVYEDDGQIAAIVPYINREDVSGKSGFRLKVLTSALKDKMLSGKIKIYIETIDGLHRTHIGIHGDIFSKGNPK